MPPPERTSHPPPTPRIERRGGRQAPELKPPHPTPTANEPQRVGEGARGGEPEVLPHAINRGGQIRTAGHRVPNAVLYQAELRPAGTVRGYRMTTLGDRERGSFPGRAGGPSPASPRLCDGRDGGDAVGGQRDGVEGDPRDRPVVAPADPGALDGSGRRPRARARRDRRRRGCECGRGELPYLAVFGICGLAFVQWFYFLAIHRLAIGIALLDPVPGAAPRGALGALRLPRAGAAADLGRARIRAHRAGADRRRAPRRRALDGRDRLLAGGRRHLRAVPPARRARARRPRPGLAARLGLRVRGALLGGGRALVELPVRPGRARTCRSSGISRAATCRSGR